MDRKREQTGHDGSNRVLTIPNLLSLLRICMVPVLVWLYVSRQNFAATAAVLLLSGLTDVVDGFIARRCHMISDLGKMLDPVADKLTQAAMLFCLVTRFPYMWIPLGLMIFKEVAMGLLCLFTIVKTRNVIGADWHGKVNTVLLYGVMVVHLLWFNIPAAVSHLMVWAVAAMMMLSMGLYAKRNILIIRDMRRES